MIPIVHGEQAAEQRSLYRHSELYEEDVPEETCVPAGTKVLRFLLVGDQNAGKSTFLHTFSRHDDRNFMSLQSFIPHLSATFLNQRFLDTNVAPMDEPPFIDTDVGRANVLLSVVNFVFFCSEFELPMIDLDPKDRFVNLQLDELGGDHLDRLVHPEITKSSQVEEAMRKSLDLIAKARRVAYFINCQTLFNKDGNLNADHVGTLKERLRFLSDQGVSEIVIYCSRIPDNIIPVGTTETDMASEIPFLITKSAPFQEDVSIDWVAEKRRLDTLAQSPVLRVVSSLVQGYSFRVCGIQGTQNLTPEGYIAVAPVVQLVTHLLTKPTIGTILSDDFLEQFTHSMQNLRANGEVWMSRAEWISQMEDCDDSATPSGGLVQMWSQCTETMCQLGILRRCYAHVLALPEVGIIRGLEDNSTGGEGRRENKRRIRPTKDIQIPAVCYPFSEGLFRLLTSDPFVRSLSGAQEDFRIQSPGLLKSLSEVEEVLLQKATTEAKDGDLLSCLRICCDIATCRSLMGRAELAVVDGQVSVIIQLPLQLPCRKRSLMHSTEGSADKGGNSDSLMRGNDDQILPTLLKGWVEDDVTVTPCERQQLSGFVYVYG